jgi:hypothetical protein
MNLIKNGWKYFSDLSLNDKVASLTDSNKLKYVNPKEIQIYEYDGDMYHVDSNHVNLMVTPNHSMYVSTRTGSVLGFV